MVAAFKRLNTIAVLLLVSLPAWAQQETTFQKEGLVTQDAVFRIAIVMLLLLAVFVLVKLKPGITRKVLGQGRSNTDIVVSEVKKMAPGAYLSKVSYQGKEFLIASNERVITVVHQQSAADQAQESTSE